jgi:uncharacterized protein (DUF2147 family)
LNQTNSKYRIYPIVNQFQFRNRSRPIRHIILLALISLVTLFSALADAQSASNELTGYWYTEDDKSIVQISKAAGKFEGKIIWLEEPRYEKGDKNAGKLKFDRLNPTKKKRKRPIVGLNVLEGFTHDSKAKKWSGGTIYDPDKGKLYKCEIKFEKDSKALGGKRLYLRGYIGIPTLGRTTSWYRVPEADLEKYELIETKKRESEPFSRLTLNDSSLPF